MFYSGPEGSKSGLAPSPAHSVHLRISMFRSISMSLSVYLSLARALSLSLCLSFGKLHDILALTRQVALEKAVSP